MRRNAQRLAALLAALALALSPVLNSGPAATASAPVEPTSILVIPPGPDPDAQQMARYSQEILDNALGSELFQAWDVLRHHPFRPENIGVGFFRFDWMPQDADLSSWVRDGSQAFVENLRHEVEETPPPWPTKGPQAKPKPPYPLWVGMISDDFHAALYKELGVPYPDSTAASDVGPTFPVLRIATGNAYSGHSEGNMFDWLDQAVPSALRGVARTAAQRKEIGAITKTILKKSAAGLAGQRSPCEKECTGMLKEREIAFQRSLYLLKYDRDGTPLARRAARILHGGLLTALRTESHKRLGRSAEEADRNLGLSSPCPVAKPALSMLAAPCDKSNEGGTGLAQALSSDTYGGVDFSTLQLRYMSDEPGSGVKYAFSATAASSGGMRDTAASLTTLKNSTADLRTWLVLDPSTFWVNLNPDEPDRIVDPDLGRTNAGRALLEADLRMKRDAGRLLDPNTPFGASYWKALGGAGVASCYSSRLWIVPGDVDVHQDGSSLYVLKAKLNVKSQALKMSSIGNTSCNADPQATAHNERLEQTMVVPKIAEAVNSAPEYAPIRQAFLARVVAQWIRDRHKDGHTTSFDSLLGSRDLGPAVLRDSWQPRNVYDSFVRSIRNGEFTYRQTARVGNTTVIYEMRTGGVDFSKLNTTKLSAARADELYPGLARTARTAADHPASASDGSLWLGQTTGSHDVSIWKTISTYMGGRTGLLVVLLAALAIVLFLLRDGSALRRKKAG
ncbi:hypothetical protein [Streptomyces sp. NPDC056670]|uniref:hypothetical protein n=1 Tax=Streptomyces sp. NPDC056670 TaxID=3345904 RepID=UPI00369A9B80